MTFPGSRKPSGLIVITYGTFDLLHVGHVNLLARAKSMGSKLVVGLSTDDFNEIEKGKKTIVSYPQRKKILLSTKFVDLVFPEKSWDQKVSDIRKYKANIFVMGDDWKGEFDYLREYCKVLYLARTKGVSVSNIIIQIQQMRT
ncbi:MAG: glycerol-3-phosphate cytidylyltransferase [Candidatus Pacebacteria bacterium CG10_big_fil_rev_8_21_14_0_10_56_10]|nr:MAG: glycerol-3-phosphate cytidylyltransferase [Candidatus Pacebacteria bacterium CG10_big_fil_rev_8_21_14_0_10_56_10]